MTIWVWNCNHCIHVIGRYITSDCDVEGMNKQTNIQTLCPYPEADTKMSDRPSKPLYLGKNTGKNQSEKNEVVPH